MNVHVIFDMDLLNKGGEKCGIPSVVLLLSLAPLTIYSEPFNFKPSLAFTSNLFLFSSILFCF